MVTKKKGKFPALFSTINTIAHAAVADTSNESSLGDADDSALAQSEPVLSSDHNDTGRVLYSAESFIKQLKEKKILIDNVYDVPVAILHENPSNPRQVFDSLDLEELADSLQEEQEQIPQGYIENERIYLIDGARRLRAKRMKDEASTLKVLITNKPKDHEELYFRARAANLSTPLSIYDDAYNFKRMRDEKGYTQQKLVALFQEKGFKSITQDYVSRAEKLTKIPKPLVDEMSRHEHFKQARTAASLAKYLEDHEKDKTPNEKLIELIQKAAKEGVSHKGMEKFCNDFLSFTKKEADDVKKTKQHGTPLALKYGDSKGELKFFEQKKVLAINLKNVSYTDYKALKEKLLEFMLEIPKSEVSDK